MAYKKGEPYLPSIRMRVRGTLDFPHLFCRWCLESEKRQFMHSCVESVFSCSSRCRASRACDTFQRQLCSVCQCVLSCLLGLRQVNIPLNIQGGSFTVPRLRQVNIPLNIQGGSFIVPSEHGGFIASLGLRVTVATLRTVVRRVAVAA